MVQNNRVNIPLFNIAKLSLVSIVAGNFLNNNNTLVDGTANGYGTVFLLTDASIQIKGTTKFDGNQGFVGPALTIITSTAGIPAVPG